MKTKLIAMILGVALILATAATLPIGVAHAQAQINTPRGTAICTGICTGQLASLTDRWWQLVLSIDVTPTQPSPFPPTKYMGDCSQLMRGNTLFLVGQTGSGFADHGTCVISPQTSVLFPLVNSIWIDCQQSFNQNATHAGLCTANNGLGYGVKQSIAATGQPFGLWRGPCTTGLCASVSGATNLVATLDKVRLQPVEVQSPPGGFEVNLAKDDPIFNLGVPTAPWHAVADGFWVLLPSLSIGTHSLLFSGCVPGGCQTNTYTLVVR